MATPRKFQSLVKLQKQGELFEVVGNLPELPKWFHSEYLKSPKAVHLEAWLVEAIFGQFGRQIPHVECMTHILLHVNQWEPDGDAEILIFGRPYYQQDVFKMIMNLADHFRRFRVQKPKAPAQEADTQQLPEDTQPLPEATHEAGTQSSAAEVQEAGTQQSPEAACDSVTRL